ncbi:ABC transporter ATP-binding protein/permease [Limosilactobacillus fermentum]
MNLNKQFGAQTVLNGVDLTITSEKIIGLIGPSGAGKTTLIKTTLGMEKADSGTSLVLGQQMPNRQILGQIGYMAQSDALYETLTAKENLAFFAQLKGVERHQLTAECQRVAKVVDLSNDLTKRVSGFSGGMKRRLSLAIALLGQPQLLILDEPTVGIDPAKTALTKQAFQVALQKSNAHQLAATIQRLVAMLPTTAQDQFNQGTASATTHIKSTYRYGDSSTGYFTKILPIFMGFFVFFFVFLISGIGLLRERSSGTLDRLLATPVRRGEIVTGYMVSYGVVAIVQTLLIVITTVWLLKVQIVGDLALVFLINILLALAALAMGIFISTFASSEFQMMQFVPIVVMPQVFFSGIVPLDALPNWIQVISKILPLTYAGNAMNDVIMKGQGVETITGDLGVLVLFIVFFVVLNVVGLNRYRKV